MRMTECSPPFESLKRFCEYCRQIASWFSVDVIKKGPGGRRVKSHSQSWLVEFVYFHLILVTSRFMQLDRLPGPSYMTLLLSKMRFVLIDDNDFTFSKSFGYFCVMILALLMRILVGFKCSLEITKFAVKIK